MDYSVGDISWQTDVLMNLRLLVKYAREIRDALVPEADAKERAEAETYSYDGTKFFHNASEGRDVPDTDGDGNG